MNYDDETLMAYADGELDAKLRAEISAAVASDPALARRVDQHRALRARVAGAFEKVLDERIPDRLAAIARGGATSDRGKVLQFPTKASRPQATHWRAREWVAMAASLMLGIFLSWRLFAPADPAVMVAGKDSLLARGELAKALESQLASEQRGEEAVLIGLTFKAKDGNYCRSFTLRTTRTAGLACRSGADWQVTATDTVPASGQMQQASSMLSPAIMQAIEARADGEAFDAEAERAAHGGGWNAAPKN